MANDYSSTSGLLKFLLPQVPGILRSAVSHTLSLSPTSSKWDYRTTITVQVLRSIMDSGGKPAPLSKVQAQTLKDPGVKGKMWVAKAAVPAPQDEGIREAVFTAISDMGDGQESYTRPEMATIPGEWTGFRPDAGAEEALPDIGEGEKYERLMAEPCKKSKTTILYLHGGAYYMCGFGTHRLNVSKLVKACGGRAFAVEYRLAPQAAFPSQLIDALNAYLYLMYPPEGALHEAAPASEIVFAGDSAGGNLVFALLQLLLQMRRTNPTGDSNPKVRYHGEDVEVPLPAGVAALSGWFDITRSLPSLYSNAKYDYLPAPKHDETTSKFPSDDIWPTKPPRGDIFADLSLICHPLVSPLAAEDWSGSPPMWLMTGEELLTDEDCVVAVRAVTQGVTVEWEQYEAMPHVFCMLLPTLATSTSCFNSCGDFFRRCVEGQVKTKGTWIAAKTGQQTEVDVSKVSSVTFEDAVRMMKEAKTRRVKGYEKEGKALPKPSL